MKLITQVSNVIQTNNYSVDIKKNIFERCEGVQRLFDGGRLGLAWRATCGLNLEF